MQYTPPSVQSDTAIDNKYSLTHKLSLHKILKEAQISDKEFNKRRSAIYKLIDLPANFQIEKNGSTYYEISQQQKDAIDELRVLSAKTSTSLGICNATIGKIITDETILITGRKQEEKLDTSNKLRSFWLRMATTAGTIIVAIGILNTALAIGLKIPRILSPYSDPTKAIVSTATQEVRPSDKTQSLKTAAQKITKEEISPNPLNNNKEKQ